jgi:nucleotide-binding universal stress UspA family protein
MKQIVVATDFSNGARNGMEYAVELAKILKMEICAIHAISPTEGIDNSIYKAIFIDDYYNKKRQALVNWADNFRNDGQNNDVKITTACEMGSLSHVLTKYIESNDVELLVIGSMDATGIEGLFGSNASTMVIKTKIPTLVIPLGTKFSKVPVITLATDFSAHLSQVDINALNDLLHAFSIDKFQVLNILETAEWKVNEAGENAMKAHIKSATPDFKYVHDDNPADGIVHFILASNTDILCVVKRHHKLVYRIFNKSTVSLVMNKSINAVLILHE